jgi:hypothetical protein
VVAHSDPHTARFSFSIEAGAISRGLLPSRTHDYLGVAIGHIIINPRLTELQQAQLKTGRSKLGPQTTETFLEIVYGARVIPSVVLRPDIQFIFRPGARSDTPTANAPAFRRSYPFDGDSRGNSVGGVAAAVLEKLTSGHDTSQSGSATKFGALPSDCRRAEVTDFSMSGRIRAGLEMA